MFGVEAKLLTNRRTRPLRGRMYPMAPDPAVAQGATRRLPYVTPPGCTPRSFGKGKDNEVVRAESETFQGEPTGRNPVQQRVVPGWKRVLRGNGATRYVKCTQRVNRPRD